MSAPGTGSVDACIPQSTPPLQCLCLDPPPLRDDADPAGTVAGPFFLTRSRLIYDTVKRYDYPRCVVPSLNIVSSW